MFAGKDPLGVRCAVCGLESGQGTHGFHLEEPGLFQVDDRADVLAELVVDGGMTAQ